MAQINFSIKDDLNKKLEDVSKRMGLAKSDYIKSLIIEDLKKFILKENKK
jgi:predicted DNA-binding protein